VTLKRREKILIFFVILAVAIWAFDRFYYAPQGRRILRLKEQIKAADQQLTQSLLLTKAVESLEAEVSRMEKELKVLNKGTLKGEEFRAFLRHLAKESDPQQLKIISLNPHEEFLPLPEGKKGAPRYQKRIVVQMVVHSNYGKLGKYLKDLQELPFSVYIESLQIERDEEVLAFLKATMGMSIYVVSN